MTEQNELLGALFLPYAMQRISAARSAIDFRFSYYTSAATGMSLLTNKEAWLRNAALMNDYSEVHHGQDCVKYCWDNTDSGKRLKALLTLLNPDAEAIFAKSFDDDQHSRTKKSYILSLSEHGDETVDEDNFGRLSMWRAYGGNTNVAFVLKSAPFLTESDAVTAYTSPVMYADKWQFSKFFDKFVGGLISEQALLSKLGWDAVFPYLFMGLRFAVLSTKHPGFSEEKEWRIIYSPETYPPDSDKKNRIIADLVTLDGVPQKIFKLPFKNFPDEGFIGAEIPEILDRIIIGPTDYPLEIQEAFIEKLQELNVPDAASKVVISWIPLRRK